MTKVLLDYKQMRYSGTRIMNAGKDLALGAPGIAGGAPKLAPPKVMAHMAIEIEEIVRHGAVAGGQQGAFGVELQAKAIQIAAADGDYAFAAASVYLGAADAVGIGKQANDVLKGARDKINAIKKNYKQIKTWAGRGKDFVNRALKDSRKLAGDAIAAAKKEINTVKKTAAEALDDAKKLSKEVVATAKDAGKLKKQLSKVLKVVKKSGAIKVATELVGEARFTAEMAIIIAATDDTTTQGINERVRRLEKLGEDAREGKYGTAIQVGLLVQEADGAGGKELLDKMEHGKYGSGGHAAAAIVNAKHGDAGGLGDQAVNTGKAYVDETVQSVKDLVPGI